MKDINKRPDIQAEINDHMGFLRAVQIGKAHAPVIRARAGLTTPATDMPTLQGLDACVRSWAKGAS